jgi:hypothetical protein
VRHVAVITIEGVLAQTSDLKTAVPTPWARQLYQALKHEYRVILLSGADEGETRWWLSKEFISDFSLLVPYVPLMSYAEWRIDQVRQMLADGWEFGLVYDTDDEVIHGVNQLGVPGMRVSPALQRSGWRDHTTEVRAWGDVVGYSG